ncbi:DUF4430 domain-containing protein [Sporosarcina sp. BP05]|uniref:DUF4430 domain-containing protein n=1 Tax=Sporosarcina sp. BP05 TaxID=2758726 RepID=UPI001648F752|nr:DUF4430 domain-containing protein [Sporosarcina sp. BP05]
MKSTIKSFVSLLVAFVMMFVLSACGTSLQKPTGLEKKVIEQEEVTDEGQLDDKEEPSELAVVDSTEDELDNKLEDIQVEPIKPVATVEKETQPTTNKNEQKQDKITPNDNAKNKPTESGGDAGEKQLSKPVVDNKKEPVVTKPVPSQPTPSKPVETPTKKPAEKEEQPETQASTITYSIVISSSEAPLPATEMKIIDGDTVLKALIAITKEKKIQMDYRGGQGATAYVEGMGNVYEFDRGQGSGWMYRVNGIFPDRGAGAVSLLAGDRVEWLYTTNLGVDLNADLKPFRR